MRRTVLSLAFVTLGVMLACGITLVGMEAEGQTKPNIIFVLTDDQIPGSENAMPNLKRDVASKGIKFTNMTSTFPLCCPGRATLQRGQYAHNTKIYGNSLPLGGWAKFKARGEQNSTVATWLNQSGYQTGLFGKYMNNYRDRYTYPRAGTVGTGGTGPRRAGPASTTRGA